ncbi:MAG: sulfatase-like hydrolase/transferase [Bdellovibrionales bacterium]|nr:sulfatase-like hydrolase/transferase [Bdellovibrionales bacterium]
MKIRYFAFGAFLALSLTGCSWNQNKIPSILVIAVEGLSFDSFSCTSEEIETNVDFSGLKVFCDEAVRFTHAYAPSTLSQPSLASMLTGLYPQEHDVHNQGRDHLKGAIQTVSESASNLGFQTLFLSGGAPIWRKSGFAQGFQIFDDNIKVNNNEFYRPIGETVDLFLSWLKQKSVSAPFFSVLYASDLQFPDVTTFNSAGEIRSLSIKSQLAEVSESLFRLVQQLRRWGYWDNTYVVLAGLNGGYFSIRPFEERAYSLYSSNTQVKLFIKPATKKRDLGLQWTIDRNVSLVDLGVTLWSMIGREPVQKSRFDTRSLLNVLKTPDVDWPQDRILISESGWPSWQEVGTQRWSLRLDQLLLIYDQNIKIYNTLIDRQEQVKIEESDPLVRLPIEKMNHFLKENEIQPWRPIPETLAEKLAVGREIWSPQGITSDLNKRLIHISKKRSWDQQVWGWRASQILAKEDWEELLKIADDAGVFTWKYVALRNLNQRIKNTKLKGCEKTLKSLADATLQRQCNDPTYLALLLWVNEENPQKAILFKENFLRLYKTQKIDTRLGELNFKNGLTWSVSKNIPAGPSLTDLALALPKLKGFARQVMARVSSENF